MSRIALVAHDAGGAELITSWAIHAENRGNEFLSSAMGPAIEIFSHNLTISSPHTFIIFYVLIYFHFLDSTPRWEIRTRSEHQY